MATTNEPQGGIVAREPSWPASSRDRTSTCWAPSKARCRSGAPPRGGQGPGDGPSARERGRGRGRDRGRRARDALTLRNRAGPGDLRREAPRRQGGSPGRGRRRPAGRAPRPCRGDSHVPHAATAPGRARAHAVGTGSRVHSQGLRLRPGTRRGAGRLPRPRAARHDRRREVTRARSSSTRRARRASQRGHPWVFRSDVTRANGASPGRRRARDGAARPARSASRSTRRGRRSACAWSSAARRCPTTSCATACGRDPLARDGRRRGLRLPPRPRRGRRAALARRRPLRRLPRDPDPLPGHGGPQGRDRGGARRSAPRPKGILERNDPRVRSLEGLEPAGRAAPRRGARARRGRGGRVALRGRPLAGPEDRASSSTSARTTLMARRYARGRVLDGFTYKGGFALQVAAQAEPRCWRSTSPRRRSRGCATTPSATASTNVAGARGQRLRPAARAGRRAASGSTP